jgi:hypothetical protein
MDPELMKIVLATMGGGNQETIAEYNPYLQFAAAPQAMAQTIQANIGKSADSNELWKNAFAASIGGLASGALQGLGQDCQGTLTDRYNETLLGTLAGQPADGSNLPSGLFGDIQKKAKLFKVQQVMNDYINKGAIEKARKIEAMKSQSRIRENLLKEFVGNEDPRVRKNAAQMLGGGAEESMPTGTSAPAPAMGKEASLPKAGEPPAAEEEMSPEFDAAANKYGYKNALKLEMKKETAKIDQKLMQTGWWAKVPTEAKSQLTHALGLTDQLNRLASQFDALAKKSGWKEWQMKQYMSDTEEYRLKQKMIELVVPSVKALGDVGNIAQPEQKNIRDATLGNITSKPADAAVRIRDLAQTIRELSASKLNLQKTALTQGGDALLEQYLKPSGAAPSSPMAISPADAIAELKRRGAL